MYASIYVKLLNEFTEDGFSDLLDSIDEYLGIEPEETDTEEGMMSWDLKGPNNRFLDVVDSVGEAVGDFLYDNNEYEISVIIYDVETGRRFAAVEYFGVDPEEDSEATVLEKDTFMGLDPDVDGPTDFANYLYENCNLKFNKNGTVDDAIELIRQDFGMTKNSIELKIEGEFKKILEEYLEQI